MKRKQWRWLAPIILLLLLMACRREPPSPPAESELVGAVMARRAGAVDSLLAAGASPNSRDEEGTPVLILAVNGGQPAIVKRLVEAGAAVNARREAYFESTALMEVGVRNDPGLAEWLLDHGADLHLQDALGDTPLNWASYYGHRDLVDLYLARGADWSVASKQGTAIDIALHRGHRELVRYFLDRGAGQPIDSAAKALFDAIDRDDPEGVRDAIRSGVPPTQTDPLESPALVVAAENGRADIVDYLLRKGADINDMNRVGETALARAARFGHSGIVDRLLSLRADPDLAGSPYRLAPLHTAARNGHADIIRELLASGADPDLQEGINGYTSLMLATAAGSAESVKALLKGGASPYLKSFEGAGLYDMLRYSNNPDIRQIIQEYLLED